MGTPARSPSMSSTAGPLVASRTAEVAMASVCSTPCSRPTAAARATAASSASTPSCEMEPSGSRKRMRRTSIDSDAAGRGRAPRTASITAVWTVLDPMSMTPRRTESR